MASNNNIHDFMVSVADAIRAKKGTTDTINPQDFASEIASISGGGGASLSSIGFSGHIDTAQLRTQGWDEGEISRLVDNIWWNEDEDDYYNENISRFVVVTTEIAPPEDAFAVTYRLASLKNISSFNNGNNKTFFVDLTGVGSWGQTGFNNLFSGCVNLRVCLLTPNATSASITTTSYAFNNCYRLIKLVVGSAIRFNSNMGCSFMFANCGMLKYITWNSTSSIVPNNLQSTFQGLSDWRTINPSLFGMSIPAIAMNNTFNGCYSAETIMGVIDVSANTQTTTFTNCFFLKNVQIKGIKVAYNFGSCPFLTHDSILYMFNNAQSVSGIKLTLGSINLAKMTAEEKAIMTGKGWTLA